MGGIHGRSAIRKMDPVRQDPSGWFVIDLSCCGLRALLGKPSHLTELGRRGAPGGDGWLGSCYFDESCQWSTAVDDHSALCTGIFHRDLAHPQSGCLQVFRT
jgi:hypothetical protein